MTNAIGPGDWVECIKGAPQTRPPLVEGALYRIRAFGPSDLGACNDCGDSTSRALELVGIDDPDWAFCHCGLRPITDGQDRIERRQLKLVCEEA